MPRHLLTAREVELAKPRSKPYRLRDGGGLYLLVSPTGAKSWQYRYTLDGKQQTATLGKYPVRTLGDARTRADESRRQADGGVHVTVEKRVQRARRAAERDNTFAAVAVRWVTVRARRDQWTANYAREVRNSLANHLAKLNALPVTEIRAALCSPLLARVERAAPDMERKVRQRLRAILDYAVEEGLLELNPLPAVRRRHLERARLPAVLERPGVGAILRAADAADVSRGVRRAHLVAAFTAQRIGEIVPAAWAEFDLEAGTWTVPRARMKRKDPERGDHVVPLPPQLLAQLREWRRTDQGGEYAFPAPGGEGHVTREAVEKFYRRALALAGRHSPHSWRTVLSTWARDAGKDGDAIEAQLDHSTGSRVQAAYDRAHRLDRRRELMAWHEAALLAARDGADVIPLRATEGA